MNKDTATNDQKHPKQPLKYLVSPHTLMDYDKDLYKTEIGIEGRNMPLHYTCWGKTQDESRQRADALGRILTGTVKTIWQPEFTESGRVKGHRMTLFFLSRFIPQKKRCWKIGLNQRPLST